MGLVIENGFTYIAFLMFIAGGLLALEKYTKWKIFSIVPPLVWIYVLNMIFCTAGLYRSDACDAAYGALRSNLLYAMIFVMLLRCDLKKIAKLGLGRHSRAVCLLGRRFGQHGRHGGRLRDRQEQRRLWLCYGP